MGKYSGQQAAGSGQQDDAEMGRDGDAARKSQRADDGRQLAGGSWEEAQPAARSLLEGYGIGVMECWKRIGVLE